MSFLIELIDSLFQPPSFSSDHEQYFLGECAKCIHAKKKASPSVDEPTTETTPSVQEPTAEHIPSEISPTPEPTTYKQTPEPTPSLYEQTDEPTPSVYEQTDEPKSASEFCEILEQSHERKLASFEIDFINSLFDEENELFTEDLKCDDTDATTVNSEYEHEKYDGSIDVFDKDEIL